MSQKVKIRRVRVHGAVYLGQIKDVDTWSSSPDAVTKWLADGWRFRFNQHRSKRSRWVEGFADQAGAVAGRALVPIGSSVSDFTDREARVEFSFLSALPAHVLQSPERVEVTEWFAAAKRRKANVQAGRPPGAMPRFHARDKTDQVFTAWFNGGANARYRRTGKRSGVVIITGRNPSGKYGPQAKLNFRVVFHVRLSEAIRSYTSVRVNLTTGSLVFVNAPLPVRSAPSGAIVGLDFGVKRTVATSDGEFFDQPDTSALEATRKRHQKRMAKSRLIALREKRQFWASKGYQGHKAAAASVSAKIARVRADWQQKTSTTLVQQHDVIGLENLKLVNMTARAHGAGTTQKRGLNRVLNTSSLGTLREMIEYKAGLAAATVVAVNPAYTSQRCNACGHAAKENRKSQAAFLCVSCGHTANADINAACNIRDDAVVTLGLAEKKTVRVRTFRPTGSKNETEKPTPGTDSSAASAKNRKPPIAA